MPLTKADHWAVCVYQEYRAWGVLHCACWPCGALLLMKKTLNEQGRRLQVQPSESLPVLYEKWPLDLWSAAPIIIAIPSADFISLTVTPVVSDLASLDVGLFWKDAVRSSENTSFSPWGYSCCQRVPLHLLLLADLKLRGCLLLISVERLHPLSSSSHGAKNKLQHENAHPKPSIFILLRTFKYCSFFQF